MEDVCTATTQIGFWNSIRDAVRGSDHDFTAGSLNRAIFLLAIPMILEMALESLFGVVDILWVARVGANAVAAVGVTESLGALLFSVVMGLSLSTSAVVARRIGEKDLEGAAVASVTGSVARTTQIKAAPTAAILPPVVFVLADLSTALPPEVQRCRAFTAASCHLNVMRRCTPPGWPASCPLLPSERETPGARGKIRPCVPPGQSRGKSEPLT